MQAIVGVDVGGTFTDVALIAGGRLVTAKVATTRDLMGKLQAHSKADLQPIFSEYLNY